MVCIYCSAATNVVNSRHQKKANKIWRRRACLRCGAIYTTIESVLLDTAVSVQYSSQDLRPFNRDMLFASIYESCKHRPKVTADASALTDTIIGGILDALEDGCIQRTILIGVASKTLQRFDPAAAAIYSAYHHA